MRLIYRKRKLLIVAALLVLIIGALSIMLVQYIKGERIKELILSELNKHLTAEVSVNKVEYGFLRSFPNASIKINGVIMKPPSNMTEAPGLMHARDIYLKFSLLDVLLGKYNIHSVEIHDASISLFTNSKGQVNYIFWKQPETNDGNVSFNFKQIRLISTTFFYKDVKKQDDIALRIDNLTLKGQYANDIIKVNANGSCISNRMVLSGNNILPVGNAIIDSKLSINLLTKRIDFISAELAFADVLTAFNGNYHYDESNRFSIILDKLEGNIPDIMKILPAKLSDNLKIYHLLGTLKLKGDLRGNANDLQTVSCLLHYELKQGEATIKDHDILFKKLKSEGIFTYNKAKGAQKLAANSLTGEINGAAFKAEGTVNGSSKPYINAELHIKGALAAFEKSLANEQLRNINGMTIADLQFAGKYESVASLVHTLTGQISVSEGNFTYNKQNVNNINGNFSFGKSKLIFDGVTLNVGRSNIEANGYINNFESMLTDKKNIYASLNLSSDKLALNDILALVPRQTPTVSARIFPPNVTFDAVLSLKELSWNKLTTQSLNGKFSLKNDVLRGSDISIQAFGGVIQGSGLINGRYGNKIQIVSTADFKNVDINQLFYQFNNFGQKSLVSNNLKGMANAKVEFATALYTDYSVNIPSIQSIADIEILNGELLDFEPMQALSGFLDAKELKNIRFATLTNRIEINNRKVIIPLMQIKSSALDLNGYGTHTFGHEIDYHVNLLLSDVIKRKNKNRVIPTGNIMDDGYGKPRLYLKFSGTLDEPVVQYDTEEVKKKVVTDLRKEKTIFKEVLQQEFGKNKEPVPGTTSPSKSAEQPKFDIEWDEVK